MRFSEFGRINEDDLSIPQMKKEIVSQVRGTKDFNVLDRVYQVLSQDGNKEKIQQAFGKNIKNGNLGGEDAIINDMMHQISTLAGTAKQKEEFVISLEKGKAVNVKALLDKTSTFEKIFISKFAEDFFMSIANYGRGNKMKGPGEFALAIMSPKIALADKGDLVISGRHIEVKSALNKSGGRLGEVGANKEMIIPVLTKVASKYAKTPETKRALKEFLSYLESHSIGITTGISRLHEVFDGDKKAIKAIVSAVLELTFTKQIGDKIGAAASKDSSGVMAEQAYMKANFEWYKKRDGFDEILAIWFGGRKTFSFSSGDELLSLRSSGSFGSASISFVPSKPNEVYAQINFTTGRASGAARASGGVSAARKTKAAAMKKPAGKMKASAGGVTSKKTPNSRNKR